MVYSNNLGYPRIGKQRELKRVIERYWSGKATEAEVVQTATELRSNALTTQHSAGIQHIPCNDFSLYDHVLDTACLWGLVPERFEHARGQSVSMQTYFAMARGNDQTVALEMTKWFDTNYHYLVPEFDAGSPYRAGNQPVERYLEARALVGGAAKPVLVGPVSFVLLGKRHTKSISDHVDELLPLYVELLTDLAGAGADWVQIDEPCLVEDRSPEERRLFERAYEVLAKAGPRLLLQTYFGSLNDNWSTAVELPVAGIGLDFVRTPFNLRDLTARGFPADKTLAAGVVNGRGVWRSDLSAALATLETISAQVESDRLWIGPSCSLLQLPYDVQLEGDPESEELANLAFAEQRLDEIALLTKAVNEGRSAVEDALARDHGRIERFRSASSQHAPTKGRVASLTAADFSRSEPIAQRLDAQARGLKLPDFPTTTIGSFPQAPDVRQMRARVHSGKITADEYTSYVHGKIDEVLSQQEEVGLDVLVHGEFERSDMVEYFAEQMAGFLKTEHGWVQSYGTRCVRPPIIIGDIHRPHAMTVDTIAYAQSRTTKPVKGMLTGSVTILNWSFAREDLPRSEIAFQIALALRDEVADLEAVGIRIVQIDEPALREGLPLVRSEWDGYLDWAIKAFRLSASVAQPATQIHSHMCYSEFNDIIAAIDNMDADVISIENSRSNEELLRAFTDFDYVGEIGPGVYDVHSARVPDVDEMVLRLENAARVLRGDVIWVNPDCGLKTRRDAEVWPSLANMVQAARKMRARVPA